MKKKKFLLGFVIILLGFLGGSILFAYSSAYAKKNEVLLDTSFIIEGGDQKFRSFFASAPVKEVFFSFSVSNGTIKFSFWPADIFEDSLGYFEYHNGTEVQMVQPWLFEGSNATMGMGIETENQVWYLLFYNENSYEKEVDVQVTKVWYEPNYLGWISGVAIMTMGTGIGLHVDKVGLKNRTVRSQNVTRISKKLFVGYSMSIFVMISLLTYEVIWSISFINRGMSMRPPEEVMSNVISPIPFFLLLEAFPISIFVYLLLSKGGGLAYLERWNLGKWSRIPASMLLSGFLIALIPAPLTFTTYIINGTSFLYLDGPNFTVFNPLYFYSIYVGSIMMLCGIVALICLWAIHLHRRHDKLVIAHNI